MNLEEQLKETLDNVGKRFDEFKKENDKSIAKGVKDALAEAKLEKLQQSIDDLTGTREALEKRIKAAEEQKARVDKLEQELKTERSDREEVERKLNLLKVEGAGEHGRILHLKKNVNVWGRAVVRSYMLGLVNLNAEEQKAIADVNAEYKSMSVADDTTGGYLAPMEYVKEIIKGVTEFSPMRNVVRVRTTAGKGIQVPKRVGQFAAQRVGEQGPRTETTGQQYGMIELVAPEMFALIDISQQNLEDSAFDLEAEITDEATTQFAVKEGAEVISGTGVGQCEGILTNTDVANSVSGTAAKIADANGVADGLMDVFHGIKTAYAQNATWLLNRFTLGSVRKLKDANKQYIWQPGLAQGVPNTILGAGYTEAPDMPNEGANLFPIAFGDWKRAYTLVDRITMTLLRDQFTQATSGNIRFLFRRRVGGGVVLAEAIRTLKCST